MFISVIIKSSEKGPGRGNRSASYACASLISAWQTAMSDGGLDVFFSHLASFLVQLDRQNRREVNNYTVDFCEYAARQAGMYAAHVYRIFVAAEERSASTLASTSASQPINDVKELVGALLSQLREIQGEWERELHVRRHSVQIPASHRARLIRHGPGRPYFDITEDQLYTLRSLGFSWTLIAEILGMHMYVV